ncbi:hypothetical protein L596_008799 [Steinernema carpocapsae]|uniref:G-protein coupled receptors family 1 profile domain-containing protein n=1 Tax=Steinernema carpocapsae TaxID=34508 RepID=A0A4V6A6E1_STECR|nr:hypothetical protein L596_008799 [Steinernema carpocapsae]
MVTTENVLVGSAMTALSVVCFLANCSVLLAIATNFEFYSHSSYKIMLLMGVFDVSQVCGHFVTGLFTVTQYNAGYWTYKALGTMLSPAYECYVFLTILLAFNRYVVLCMPWLETRIFSSLAIKIWFLLTLLIFAFFGGIHLSDKIYSHYVVAIYKWKYEHAYPWSEMRQNLVIYYQLFGVFFAWLFYVAITINLFHFRNHLASQTRYRANQKILLHAFVIILYSTFMNVCWHKIDLMLPEGKTQNFVINMMWIGNSGLSPFLCLLLSRLLRTRVLAILSLQCCRSRKIRASNNVAVVEANVSRKTSVRTSHENARMERSWSSCDVCK